MPKFNGAKIAEPLEFDLTAWRPDPNADGISDDERARRQHLATLPWQGIIPEPAEHQMRSFFASVSDISLQQAEADEQIIDRQKADLEARWREAHPDEDKTPAMLELIAWDSAAHQRANLAELNAERANTREKFRTELAGIIADFCSDVPPAEVLLELPWRPLQHFLGWLSGEFSPETLAAAMKR